MTCSRSVTRSSVSALSSSTTACEAGDDDAKEVGNGGNDGLEDVGDSVNDCHDASTNGLEKRLDLLSQR